MTNKTFLPCEEKTWAVQPFETVDINSLSELLAAHGLRYVLVYALDGVLWGSTAQDGLQWGDTPQYSQCSSQPQFWQEVRCFGENAELHLWRTDAGWRGRLVALGAGQTAGYVQRVPYLLWGGRSKNNPAPQDGFAVLAEALKGIRQVAPTLPSGVAPSRLLVRHFYQPDRDGQLQFQFSCLAGLA